MEMGVLEVGVRRGSLLQDRLPVKFQDVKFQDPKLKHEIFARIGMKHSYILLKVFHDLLAINFFCC